MVEVFTRSTTWTGLLCSCAWRCSVLAFVLRVLPYGASESCCWMTVGETAFIRSNLC